MGRDTRNLALTGCAQALASRHTCNELMPKVRSLEPKASWSGALFWFNAVFEANISNTQHSDGLPCLESWNAGSCFPLLWWISPGLSGLSKIFYHGKIDQGKTGNSRGGKSAYGFTYERKKCGIREPTQKFSQCSRLLRFLSWQGSAEQSEHAIKQTIVRVTTQAVSVTFYTCLQHHWHAMLWTIPYMRILSLSKIWGLHRNVCGCWHAHPRHFDLIFLTADSVSFKKQKDTKPQDGWYIAMMMRCHSLAPAGLCAHHSELDDGSPDGLALQVILREAE